MKENLNRRKKGVTPRWIALALCCVLLCGLIPGGMLASAAEVDESLPHETTLPAEAQSDEGTDPSSEPETTAPATEGTEESTAPVEETEEAEQAEPSSEPETTDDNTEPSISAIAEEDTPAALAAYSGTLTINDTIKDNGRLTVTASGLNTDQKATFRWEKSADGKTWENVERTKVTGDAYNMADDGSWVNVALDKGAEKYYRATIATIDGADVGEPVISHSFQVTYYDALKNGSFENPENTEHQNNSFNGTQGLYWKTTDTDHGVEIINVDKGAWEYHGVVSVPDGSQAAEINAEDDAALYQDVLTTPGSTMYWSLMHMGRIAKSGFDLTGLPDEDGKGQINTDTMYVVIMPTSTAETAGDDSGEVDTYSEVSRIMENASKYPDVQVTKIDYTWYWVRSSSDDTYTYTMHYVAPNGSDTVVGTVTESWWGSYNTENFKNIWQNTQGTYEVPDNQYLTRYFFVSGATAAGDNTIGNMVDQIHFSTQVPPPVAGTANLTIQKTLAGADMTDEQLKEAKDGLSFTANIGGTEYTVDGSKMVWKGKVGTWTTSVSVPANGTVSYSVTENNPTAPDGFTVTPSETLAQTGTLTEKTAATVCFTNTYVRSTTSVTISKNVTGNMGDRNKDFTFTFKVGKDGKEDKFDLRHNGTKKLTDLTIGETLYIMEEHGSYTPTVTYTVGKNTTTVTANEDGWYAIPIAEDTTVTVENNYNVTIDTGIFLDSAPYVLLLGVLAAGAVLLRKRRYSDD